MSSTARRDRSSTCTRSFRINCIPLLTGLFADTFIFLLTRSRRTRRFRQELLSYRRCLQRKIYRITVGQIFVLVRRGARVLSSLCTAAGGRYDGRQKLRSGNSLCTCNWDSEIILTPRCSCSTHSQDSVHNIRDQSWKKKRITKLHRYLHISRKFFII